MSDYVYESGMSTKRRRQRRTAITMLLTLLLLFGAFWWAWAYMRDGEAESGGKTTESGCIDAKAATFNVYNATNRSGLARSAADALTAAGFKVGKVANDPERKKLPGHVEIRFGPAGKPYATSFKQDYGQSVSMTPVERDGSTLDVVLGDAFQEWNEFPEKGPC
ncbi:MAG TPA: LytR C-terminal domain-containing protein [Intrasporangiaceae bacterium]|nr:LytR C-terminal domain-containing protein [Intrasporangiaceae bacterium]